MLFPKAPTDRYSGGMEKRKNLNGGVGWLLAMATLLSVTCTAQVQVGKSTPPDIYDFGFNDTSWTPRYKHDPDNKKLILNPDFFCTQCAKEGRIKFKTRDEMKEFLETDKRYPNPLQGKTKDHFGTFRLLEQEAQVVLDRLFKKMKLKSPVFIEDRFFRIFTDLGKFHTKKPPYRRREFELQQLADIFPKISKKTINLNSHHRAHRVKEEFENLVGFKEKAAYMDYNGPYHGLNQKFEIYMFRKKKDCMDFVQDVLGQAQDDGLCWHLLSERAMISFQQAQGRPDVFLNNTFTHRLAYNFIVGFRSYQYDLPAWITLGYAHLMERRERTNFNTLIFGEGRIPKFRLPKKWKVGVKKMVLANKMRPFQQIADFENVASIKPSEHPLIWSQCSYLMQLDQKKFGKMIHVLKDKKTGESTRNLLIRALRMSFGLTLSQIDEGWKAWVKETYPSI